MALLAFLIPTAFAEPQPVVGPALEKMANEVEASKQALQVQEEKKRKVLATLYELNRKARRGLSAQSKLSAERQGLQESVLRLNVQLAELEKSSAELKTRLSERLKAIHRLGGFSVARVLLSSSNSSTLDRNLKIMGLIARKDRDLVRQYRAVTDEISSKKSTMTQRMAQIEDLQKNLSAQEQKLAGEQKLKTRLLEGIRRKKVFAQQSLAQLKEKSLSISGGDDAALDALFKPSFAEAKGTLKAPVAGVIARKFGIESSESHTWSLSHKGIRFAAPAGRAVHSVFPGKVAWTGDIPGLGQALVVDHGDHYYTVFANTEHILVKPGDEVRRDQVIGSSGEAPLEQGPGLYFEIRHFSEPYDPQLWLKGTAL